MSVSGQNTVAPALFVNDNSFYSPTVIPPNATLFPALYANDNEFFRPTVTPGAINLAPALLTNVNAFYAASAYQFWNIRPYFFLNINTVFPPVVLRGKPIPNWNPDTIANDTNYDGADLVANPNFTPQPTPPAPTFNPDGQTATPDWNPP